MTIVSGFERSKWVALGGFIGILLDKISHRASWKDEMTSAREDIQWVNHPHIEDHMPHTAFISLLAALK